MFFFVYFLIFADFVNGNSGFVYVQDTDSDSQNRKEDNVNHPLLIASCCCDLIVLSEHK